MIAAFRSAFSSIRSLLLTALLFTVAPASAEAPWTLRTRAVMSGSSDNSTPSGFVIYSGIALDAALSRSFGRVWAVEAGLRTESREVDMETASGPADRLGSLELLPFTVTLQYRPGSDGTLHPYAGVGANVTVTWEKSGVLDSTDVAPHFGPALQLGLDLDLSETLLFNLDVRWHTLTLDIMNDGVRLAELRVDPLELGAGVGLRF